MPAAERRWWWMWTMCNKARGLYCCSTGGADGGGGGLGGGGGDAVEHVNGVTPSTEASRSMLESHRSQDLHACVITPHGSCIWLLTCLVVVTLMSTLARCVTCPSCNQDHDCSHAVHGGGAELHSQRSQRARRALVARERARAACHRFHVTSSTRYFRYSKVSTVKDSCPVNYPALV